MNAITRGAGSGTCCDAGPSCCAWSLAAVVGAFKTLEVATVWSPRPQSYAARAQVADGNGRNAAVPGFLGRGRTAPSDLIRTGRSGYSAIWLAQSRPSTGGAEYWTKHLAHPARTPARSGMTGVRLRRTRGTSGSEPHELFASPAEATMIKISPIQIRQHGPHRRGLCVIPFMRHLRGAEPP